MLDISQAVGYEINLFGFDQHSLSWNEWDGMGWDGVEQNTIEQDKIKGIILSHTHTDWYVSKYGLMSISYSSHS